MEVTDEQEILLVVTARKIRQFNEIMIKQRALGADDDSLQASIDQRNELEQKFQWLSVQVRAVEVVA